MINVMPHYSYANKRKCLLCETPIADQAHASTKFCPRFVLPDGTIKSCKDDYHSPLRKEKYEPYKRIADFQRETHKKIEALSMAKGEIVTIEQIDQYGINLHRPVQFEVDSMQKTTFYFIEYELKQLPNKQFKISKHGKLF